jgi:hypothetical protein
MMASFYQSSSWSSAAAGNSSVSMDDSKFIARLRAPDSQRARQDYGRIQAGTQRRTGRRRHFWLF